MQGNGTAISAADHGRRYDIDALRVFAFGILILYHVGMFYVAEWGWHVKSAYQSEWLQLPMVFSNQWRMGLLFLISGLALRFVWHKYSAGRLALRRIWRLLLPLVFGMAFIVAPQPYYEALAKGLIEPGFLRFMAQYLTFHDFPGEAWGGENIITWTWNHLWYLPYVLFYSLLLIAVTRLFGGAILRLRRGFLGLRGVWLVVVPVLPLMLYGSFVFPHFPGITHDLISDWYAHAMYFTLFVYGFLLGRDSGIWSELARLRVRLLMLGLASFTALQLAFAWIGDEPGMLLDQLRMLIIYLNRWTWIITVLAWGHHWVSKPLKWLPYATAAVYPWYILHQTITVTAGYELSVFALGPVLEPALVLAATIAGCALIYEYVIRRIALLRPLFGLSYAQVPPAPPWAGRQPARESDTAAA